MIWATRRGSILVASLLVALAAGRGSARARYGQLKRAMLERMQRDATLHSWLQAAVDGP